MSGAQRLPNGNTLICTGFSGTIFEVTPEKETVWDYINPAKAASTMRRFGFPPGGRPGFGGPGAQRQQVMNREIALPDSAQRHDKACVFADGTTVHTEGDGHEIRVTTVTVEDAAGKILGRQSRARFLPVDDVAWVLLLLARGLGYQHARLRAFVADGAQWLWKLADAYFTRAIQIRDWYHLAEHVHKAAKALHGEGTAATGQWAKRLKDELSEGRVAVVLEWCERNMPRRVLRGSVKHCTNWRPIWRIIKAAWTTRATGPWACQWEAGKSRRSVRCWSVLVASRDAQLDLPRRRGGPAPAGSAARWDVRRFVGPTVRPRGVKSATNWQLHPSS